MVWPTPAPVHHLVPQWGPNAATASRTVKSTPLLTLNRTPRPRGGHTFDSRAATGAGREATGTRVGKHTHANPELGGWVALLRGFPGRSVTDGRPTTRHGMDLHGDVEGGWECSTCILLR